MVTLSAMGVHWSLMSAKEQLAEERSFHQTAAASGNIQLATTLEKISQEAAMLTGWFSM